MKIVNCGVDRLRFSLSDYSMSNNNKFVSDFIFNGSSKGYDWYRNALGSVGFSHDKKYCVVEMYALFFLKNLKGFKHLKSGINNFLALYFERYFKIKISRIDVYIDQMGTVVYPLKERYYCGRSETHLTEHKKDDVGLGSSYLETKSKSWLVRRYNKTAEIANNKKEYRYSDTYKNGVIRTEYSYGKNCLRNLSSRSIQSVFGYILKHLKTVDIPESKELIKRIQAELTTADTKFKSSKGNYSGSRLKLNILKRTAELKKEYLAVGGNETDFITKLIEMKL
jgi:hypothetical protein